MARTTIATTTTTIRTTTLILIIVIILILILIIIIIIIIIVNVSLLCFQRLTPRNCMAEGSRTFFLEILAPSKSREKSYSSSNHRSGKLLSCLTLQKRAIFFSTSKHGKIFMFVKRPSKKQWKQYNYMLWKSHLEMKRVELLPVKRRPGETTKHNTTKAKNVGSKTANPNPKRPTPSKKFRRCQS